MKQILIFFFLLFLVANCQESSPKEEFNLTPQLECAPETAPLPLSEYVQSPSLLEFKKLGTNSINYGYTKNAYICRWENSEEPSLSSMDTLVVGISEQDYIDILLISKDKSSFQIETGDRRPKSSSVSSDYPYAVSIQLKQVQTILFKLSNHDGLHESLTFTLTTEKAFQKKKHLSTSLEFFLIGAIASLILYNLLIALDSKDKSHFYFVGYLLFFLLYYTIYTGRFSEFPFSPFINNSGLLIAACYTVLFINLFLITSLDLQNPKIHKFLSIFIGLYISNSALLLFDFYAFPLLFLTLLIFSNIFILFPILISSVLKIKNTYSLHLLLTFLPMMIGGIVFLCKVASIFESNLFTENSYFMGSVLQIILFSYLLSQKFNTSMKMNLEYQKKIAMDTEKFTTALQGEKDRVTHAYFELEASEKQLIQSDRMITLGTLVAGVAHEINTPLGAIKASGENINTSLKDLLGAISNVIPDTLKEDWSLVVHILEQSQALSQTLSSKESRAIKKSIKQDLETLHVDAGEELADMLLELGLYQQKSLQKEIFLNPNYLSILRISHLMQGIFKKANTIELSAERVSKIVKSLKSYMHFDTKEEMVPAALSDTMETVLTILHSKIKSGIEVQTHYELIPYLYCYPDELGQIFTNLIHNSIQAMDGNGKITIEIKLIDIPDWSTLHSPFPISLEEKTSFPELYSYDKFLSISIEDNGPGIPEELQKKIFEPFFTTKKAGEGSGLGLHIIRKIIEKHNGFIELFSHPGNTKFTVGIPARLHLRQEPPTP